MPPPTQVSLKSFMVTALLSKTDDNGQQRYVKKVLDPNTNQLVSQFGLLPDELDNMVDAMAEGIANQWTAWQIAQGVFAVDTVTAAPVVGTGPTALP